MSLQSYLKSLILKPLERDNMDDNEIDESSMDDINFIKQIYLLYHKTVLQHSIMIRLLIQHHEPAHQ